MTVYVAGYDLENVELAVPAARKLVEIHRKYEAPATFFCLARVVEEHGEELRKIFGNDPLFDIQSHTYTHRMLRDHKIHGPAIPLEEMYFEVGKAADLIGDVLGKRPIGMRSPCGFEHGMKGEPERLKIIVECGMKYISTQARGPQETIPAPLNQPFNYAEDGFPQLWELPAHGWHDNVLKGFTGHPTMFPPIYPFAGRLEPVRSPREDFEAAKPWIDYALEQKLTFVSLAYHPWSLYKLDPDCGTIDLLLPYIQSKGMEIITYTELYRRVSGDTMA